VIAGGYFSFWLFSKTTSWVPWAQLGAAAVCAVVAGVLSWRKLWPNRNEPGVAPGPLESHWAPAAMLAVGQQDAALFRALRTDFPNARIVVIGYPYLFPDTQAGWSPDDCASILRRYDYDVRLNIRGLEDEFNNLIYEEAVAAHIEFVSTRAIWRGHEPCGSRGQYTNAIKPFLSFGDPIDNGNVPNPVDRGSFHPDAAGQQTIAALVSCYLNDYPSPPNPRVGGGSAVIVVPGALVPPAAIGLVSSPGFASSLPGCR
jgi:hypothetical protein